MHRATAEAHLSADGSVAERLLDRTQVAIQGPDLTSSDLLMEIQTGGRSILGSSTLKAKAGLSSSSPGSAPA